MTELLTLAEKYINIEETLNPRRPGPSHEKTENKRNEAPSAPLTRLNTSKTNILMEVKDMKELKWPSRMKSSPDTRDRGKYFEFHRDHGHTIDDCHALQREIEALIKRGFLKNYIGHDKRPRNDCDNRKEPGAGSSAQPTAGTINIIVGDIASGGDTRFGGGVIIPEGIIELNKIQAIVSTFYLAMKFSTGHCIRVVRGDQTAARQCYVTSIRGMSADVMQLADLKLELEPRGRLALVEELEVVELEHEKAVTIGRDLKANLREKVISCLSHNIDVFAWKVGDMPGIDLEVAVHKLNISPRAKSVKQRKGQFAPKRRVVIQEEVGKLLGAGFIREVQYPDWLANVVLVKKPRGYHQILMAKEDQEKTSFMADLAIYCYRVMPFGLKNARATYQRLINKVFVDLIGKNIEAYVDDMVVKSKKVEEHISYLEEVFATLRKYKMKFNPEKCVFGIVSGKFLGFMITHRGIEANPDKIQALAVMESPRTKKEIQKLIGRVAALNKFMSRAANMCFPFFKALRGNHCFEWSEECEKAFQELKQTLESPLILTKPKPGDTLYLYLAVSQNAVSGVLVKEVNRETRYTLAEQLALALIVAARKLRQYFQLHPIVVLTNQLLKHILQKPDVSGRLLQWAIELGEFDIEFKPRPSIKAQALADFIAELTLRPRGPDGSSSSTTGMWQIFIDGASNSSGLGAVVIIISPDMLINIQCALRFEFEGTNNEAEYEAVIIAMELAINLELENIKIYSDSQLVVEQIEGTFNRKDEKMSLYCLKVHDLQRKFKSCEIVKISRAKNCRADALSRLVFMGINGLDRTVHVRIITESSINQTISVMDIDNEPSCMDPIVDFIKHSSLPEDPWAARSIRSKALRYCMIEGVLFRRSLTLPYLRYLRPSESSQALEEVHEGVCGNHQGARALAFKLIRYGYYWPTMKKDAQEYVKKCDKCQREQLKFVAVAVEYFTKWVEAEALATISEPKLRDLRTRIGEERGSWSDELPSILWTYRTSYRTAMGKTPSMLAFGIEATVPIEVRLPSQRRLELKDAGRTTEQLDLLEEVHNLAALKMASDQDRIAKYFNKKSEDTKIQGWRPCVKKGRSSRSCFGKARTSLGRALRSHTTTPRRRKQFKGYVRKAASKTMERRELKDILQVTWSSGYQ
ncbi:uncharacterized protein LOC111389949 [Olea europaea var. sylvestris]|uniref:uncharacterized protein LOC111389949 n=1 Tax=Olea europaea var. sylvestris TaxID=158386 RepID=UPI000C1D1E84|nr:uncharacterized protein LOC111389949 [Olea europaea var. sylvestris]